MRDLPRGTQVADVEADHFAYGAVTLSGPPFLTGSARDRLCDSTETLQGPVSAPTTPAQKRLQPIALSWFGLFPFRSPLLREYSPFLPLLRCFSSRTYLTGAYSIQPRVTRHYPGRVSPFGHSRITACMQLPETFRRLPRPSSALGAKASTPCPV